MPVIHYQLLDGSVRSIEAANGRNLMEIAILNNVRGVDGECGGCCSCATCHVYVDERYLDKLPEPDEMEGELLEGVASERRANSRLGCQVIVSDALDGMQVGIPVSQS
ncbi:UNVERIFIED_CONTAM: 2Fe-2S iron-sulfur cluster-binding protein [Comamonas sp. A-3]|uniref:Ferredoxin n=1 Tax=Comamonas testosteroni (strain DSM 14576 / KF-1) TaxID=399795 RepID=B7WTY4_COMTK|nr:MULTISPECIES: 2Fe-2S iron-sulfur cluster-binding protein [Comamonas]EED69255.1 ferredoxin [Comamonas testosteroni KF-1]MDN5502934.1 2Fe-2S iron-sulfur cluster-binding protein [Comamonas sp.]MDN5536359.1 2Fe-2S iron-sulfur cluster-binding protein [Comamonas sp.]WQG67237.1 2Fe-2S iron-sulfur cluster-binding protein [Comamonas testosteroni]